MKIETIENHIEANDIEFIKNLIKNEEPDFSNNFLIRAASKLNKFDIVELLLKDERVNPSAENNEALLNSVINKNTEIFELLIKDEKTHDYIYLINNTILLNKIEFLILFIKNDMDVFIENTLSFFICADNKEAANILFSFEPIRNNLRTLNENIYNKLLKKELTVKLKNF